MDHLTMMMQGAEDLGDKAAVLANASPFGLVIRRVLGADNRLANLLIQYQNADTVSSYGNHLQAFIGIKPAATAATEAEKILKGDRAAYGADGVVGRALQAAHKIAKQAKKQTIPADEKAQLVADAARNAYESNLAIYNRLFPVELGRYEAGIKLAEKVIKNPGVKGTKSAGGSKKRRSKR